MISLKTGTTLASCVAYKAVILPTKTPLKEKRNNLLDIKGCYTFTCIICLWQGYVNPNILSEAFPKFDSTHIQIPHQKQ